MGDVVLFVEDLKSNSATSHCRICHEEEFESCRSLEAPCACSGTVKVTGNEGQFLFYFIFFLIPILAVSLKFIAFAFSMHTETAYRGGVTRRETQFAKSVSRFDFR